MTEPDPAPALPVEHWLRIGRRPLGAHTYGRGGTLYGTTGRCSCGWEGRDNNAPSKGGRVAVRKLHDSETGARAALHPH